LHLNIGIFILFDVNRKNLPNWLPKNKAEKCEFILHFGLCIGGKTILALRYSRYASASSWRL